MQLEPTACRQYPCRAARTDGRDWCVLFAQDACNTDQQRTWALTEEEQAFVLSNFPLFAAHFKAISDEDMLAA